METTEFFFKFVTVCFSKRFKNRVKLGVASLINEVPLSIVVIILWGDSPWNKLISERVNCQYNDIIMILCSMQSVPFLNSAHFSCVSQIHGKENKLCSVAGYLNWFVLSRNSTSPWCPLIHCLFFCL